MHHARCLLHCAQLWVYCHLPVLLVAVASDLLLLECNQEVVYGIASHQNCLAPPVVAAGSLQTLPSTQPARTLQGHIGALVLLSLGGMWVGSIWGEGMDTHWLQ